MTERWLMPDLRSASGLDRLGERLKKGKLDRSLLTALTDFRNDYIESTERVSQLQELYPDCRVIDRRERSRYGYRAVHVVVRHGRCLIEIQVRTKLQNAWAQYSEKLADVYGVELKYGGGNQESQRRLVFLSNAIKQVELIEIEADQRKRFINPLLQLRRDGHPLSAQQNIKLKTYEDLRRGIRAARAGWLQYLKKAQA